jgi:hypothetical protein
MKKLILWIIFFITVGVTVTSAQSSRMATEDDIKLLKQDLLDGSIKINKTRLRSIISTYGKSTDVTENESRLTYDYGDLKIVFSKNKYLRKWEMDSSKTPVYSRAVDQLRFDLQSEELVGDFINFERIRRNYGEPTARLVMDGDGEASVYYYGKIKLIFENVVEIESWRGEALEALRSTSTGSGGVLGAGID